MEPNYQLAIVARMNKRLTQVILACVLYATYLASVYCSQYIPANSCG